MCSERLRSPTIWTIRMPRDPSTPHGSGSGPCGCKSVEVRVLSSALRGASVLWGLVRLRLPGWRRLRRVVTRKCGRAERCAQVADRLRYRRRGGGLDVAVLAQVFELLGEVFELVG